MLRISRQIHTEKHKQPYIFVTFLTAFTPFQIINNDINVIANPQQISFVLMHLNQIKT